MALSDIIKKILDEATTKVAEIENETQQKMVSIDETYIKKLQNQKDDIVKKMEQKKSNIEKRMNLLAKMEQRNQLLKKKQAIIMQVFEKSLNKLWNLDESKYVNILTNLMKSLPQNNSNEAIIPAKNKTILIEKALQSAGLSLKVLPEGDFKGGFIYRSDDVEINNSFEQILMKTIKPELEPEVARLLFNK